MAKNYVICKFVNDRGDERLVFIRPTDGLKQPHRKNVEKYHEGRMRSLVELGYALEASVEVDKCEYHNRRAEYSVWELFRALDRVQDVKSMRKYMGMPYSDYENSIRRLKDQIHDIQYRFNRSVNILSRNDLDFTSEIAIGCYQLMQKDPGTLVDGISAMCQI